MGLFKVAAWWARAASDQGIKAAMGLGGPAWALSLGQASSGRRKPGPWRGSLIPSFILHVFVEHLICAMQTPCSVLGYRKTNKQTKAIDRIGIAQFCNPQGMSGSGH